MAKSKALSFFFDTYSRVVDFLRSSSDELRYNAINKVWWRWVFWFVTVAYTLTLPDLDIDRYHMLFILNGCFALSNGALHLALRTRRSVSGAWWTLTVILDTVMVLAATSFPNVFQPYIFLALFASLSMYSLSCNSLTLCVLITSLVTGAYAAVALILASGPEFQQVSMPTLMARIAMMFAISITVNQLASYQRTKWQSALADVSALHRDRIELSQRIHDTSAQSAYMIGLGIENALTMVRDDQKELQRTLTATSDLSRTAMWELRQPVDVGLIYEGQTLSRVLEVHLENFRTLTSVPTSFTQVGVEPPLGPEARARIFSIAHNALTNALRHAQASLVQVELEFTEHDVRLTVGDDGIGLPDDYTDRGHGFRNMQTAAKRLGGELRVDTGGPDLSTTVAAVVPVDPTLIRQEG